MGDRGGIRGGSGGIGEVAAKNMNNTHKYQNKHILIVFKSTHDEALIELANHS